VVFPCLLIFVLRVALSSQNGTPPFVPPKFLQQFSSADDVKRELFPVLDRSVDILAGPAEAHPTIHRLVAPYAITTDRAHRIYVTDPEASAVHIFDFANSRYTVLGGRGSHIRLPFGIAADRDGNIYVTDTALAAVLVYGAKGQFLHYLGKVGRESYFEAPAGIAIHEATGHIYVCDSRRHMVLLLDKKGHLLNHLGKRWGGKGEGDFRYPSQIAISGNDVLVLDRGNSRLQVLDLDGHFRREIKLEEVHNDTGLAVDDDKNIYLSDPQLNVVRVYDYDGQFLYKFGHPGTKPGDFDTPSGLWVESGKGLYVADTRNKRVQLFQLGDRPVP
jgi:DNA-binding beta-propeller fold protein YncE